MGSLQNMLEKGWEDREWIIFRLVQLCCGLWGFVLLLSYRWILIPFFVMAVVTIPIHRFDIWRKTREYRSIGMVIAGFMGWSYLSILWSQDTWIAVTNVCKVTGLVVGLLSLFSYFKSLSPNQSKKILKSFLLGMGIILYILLLDFFLEFPLLKIKSMLGRIRCVTTVYCYVLASLVLSIFLAASYVNGGKKERGGWKKIFSKQLLIFPALLLLIVFSYHYEYDAATWGLAVGTLFFFLTWIGSKWLPQAFRYGLVALFLAAPVVISATLTPAVWKKLVEMKMPHTHRQRLELLEWGNDFIKQKPLIGQGFSQTKVLEYAHHRPHDYGGEFDPEGKFLAPLEGGRDPGLPRVHTGYWGMVAWHMHNGLMQIWVELGLVGALLAAAFLWMILKRMESFQVTSYQRALFYGFFFTLLFMFSVSFGVWESWWLVTLAFLFQMYYLNFKVFSSSQ